MHPSHSLNADPQDLTPYVHKPWPKILRDNSRSWHKWESARDFHAVMAAQYGTTCQEKHVSFGDSVTGNSLAPVAVTIPLAQYWAYRLQCHPEKSCPMDLLKVQISKDARIPKCVLDARIKEYGLEEQGKLRNSRAAQDNLRLALSYQLRPFRKFYRDDMRCKVISENTVGEKLDIHLQVQCVDKEKVSHTEDLAVIRQSTPDEQRVNGWGPMCTVFYAGHDQFSDITDLLHAGALEPFGAQHYFEGDLRDYIDSVLDTACVKLWPGLRLVLTKEAADLVRTLQSMLQSLDAGSVNLNLLSLDNTAANRDAIARELSEQFSEALGDLEERCGITAPNVKKISAEFAALQTKIDIVEQALGVELDYLDAAMSVERALGEVS